MIKVLCVLGAVLASTPTLRAADAPGGLPARYRDLKVYTVSEPKAGDDSRIVVTLQWRNEGKTPLDLHAKLEPSAKAGFDGAKFDNTLAAAARADWTFEVHPPADLKYEILKGEISFGDRPDRELFIALQGRDPADFKAARMEKVTATAQAVAAYAPRTLQSIRRSVDASRAAAATTRMVVLAAAGKSKYRILVALPQAAGKAVPFEQWAAAPGKKPAEQDLVDAVNDLQRCIQLKSGATLPIGGAESAGDSPAIRISAGLKPPANWPHPDAYRIKTTPAGDVLIEATTLDGARQGIYGLLTDHLDCHWFGPGEVGEEIGMPPDRAVAIGAIDELKSPSFFSVNGMSWSGAPQWDRRIRSLVNRGRMNFGHAWANLVPGGEQSYKQHPDSWARDRQGNVRKFDNGWSSTNFCSTSPEVIEMVARKINEQFDADPEALVMSLDPNDYAPMCLCDRCLTLDKSYGQTRQDGKQVADRLLHFSSEIRKRLSPKNQDKFLGMLIYGYQMQLPRSAKPNDHHAGTICQFPPRYDHSRPFNDPTSRRNRKFSALVRGWGALLPQMGFYDYYGQYYFFGPWAIVHKMREDLPAFKDAGGSFVVIEAQPNFGMNGLDLYIAARLTWDLDADVDALMEEYFTRFYGPAADPMRSFWLGAERYYALIRPGADTARRVAADPQFWSELGGYLEQAAAAIASPGVEQRFRDRVSFNREGFDLGKRMFDAERKFFPTGGKPDFSGAVADGEKNQPFYDALKKKYPGTGGYWPPMLATYFYPDLAQLKEMQKAAANAPPPEETGPNEDADDATDVDWLTSKTLGKF